MHKEHKHTDHYKVYRITEKESIYEKTLGETYYEIVFENMNNKKKIKTEVAVNNLNFRGNGWDFLLDVEGKYKQQCVWSFEPKMINRRDPRQKPKSWHTFVNRRDNEERINADSLVYASGIIEIEVICNHIQDNEVIQETDGMFKWDKQPNIETREVVNTDIGV